jgi:phosphatidylinositol-3-phosphatase
MHSKANERAFHMRCTSTPLLAIFAFLLFCCGCGGGASVGLPSGGGPSGNPPASEKVPQFAHVVLVIEENHSYADVIGNANMPYFNHLASSYGLATQYFANAHPSLPNYFMLAVGDAVTTDDNYAGVVTEDNIVRAVSAAGKSWKCYAESLPSVGYLGSDVYPYAKHHNPFVYLSDVLNAPAEAQNVTPFTQFASDLANNALPDYVFIVPNLNDDGHDCPAGLSACSDTQKLASADNWLMMEIDPLIQSPSFQNTLLVVTFDEGDESDVAHGGGEIATLIVSPKAKVGYHSVTLYQHQSTLRMMAEGLGLTDLPGASAAAADMAEFFN